MSSNGKASTFTSIGTDWPPYRQITSSTTVISGLSAVIHVLNTGNSLYKVSSASLLVNLTSKYDSYSKSDAPSEAHVISSPLSAVKTAGSVEKTPTLSNEWKASSTENETVAMKLPSTGLMHTSPP